MTGIHHYSIVQNSFPALKIAYVLLIHPSPINTVLFTVSMILPFPDYWVAEIIEFKPFAD
jgi:hypothetical protein